MRSDLYHPLNQGGPFGAQRTEKEYMTWECWSGEAVGVAGRFSGGDRGPAWKDQESGGGGVRM